MTVRPNNKKKTFKGKFEPVIDSLFQGMADEFGYKVHYEPTKYDITIKQTYVPDFELSFANGRPKKVIECKGFFRYEDQRKVLAFRRDYPELDYYLIFQKNKPIRKGSKTTYLDWAQKHGIPAVEGETVPEEWLK